MNIFLCHLQGGEIKGSIDESIRHSITKLANLHLVSKKSRKKELSIWVRIPNMYLM